MVTKRDYIGEAAQALDPIRQAFEDRIQRRTNLGILPIPTQDTQPVRPVPGDQTAEGSNGGIELLSATFNKALQKLVAASGGKVSISSQKRDHERQAKLFADAVKKYGSAEAARKWVAPPGGSMHEMGSQGSAADLKYADEATKKWVRENAARFGLYFPLNNEDWHVELIGGPRSKKRAK